MVQVAVNPLTSTLPPRRENTLQFQTCADGSANSETVTWTTISSSADLQVLPTNLVFFKGELSSPEISLKWQTAGEKNNEKYEIETSDNGLNFRTLGSIEGNGTTTDSKNYSFKVSDPSVGFNYFRLKQIDFDGQFEFSNIISIHFLKNFNPTANFFPNPTHSGWINLNYISAQEQEIDIFIFDQTGKIMLHKTEYIVSGKNHLKLDFTELNQGIYVAKIKGENGVIPRLLIIN